MVITQEKNPRVEICAKQMHDGKMRRVHVITLTLNTWGKTFERDAKLMFDELSKGNITKDMVLKLRNDMAAP